MFKKAILLISIILVLALVSETAVAADPSLLGWWNFDDGTANDSSGGGHHGTIRGDVTIIEDANIFGAGNKVGYFPGGEGHDISCGGGGADTWANGMAEITIAAWVQIDEYTTEYQYIAAKEGAWRLMRFNDTTSPRFFTNGSPSSLLAITDIQGGEWHHICGVSDGTTKYIYIDGVLENSVTRELGIYDSTYNIIIGGTERSDNLTRMWKGLIDDVRLYDRALVEFEVRGLAGMYMAYDPNPENEAENVLVTLPSLIWKPGAKVAATQGHKVYLGTSQALVEANDVSVYKGAFDSNSYSGAPMGSLALGTTYYWRVIEVNGVNEWPDEVWQFSTPPLEATEPDPPDGAKYVSLSRTKVGWRAGVTATNHSVYFGTSKALIDANDASVYKGQFAVTSDPNWPISPALIAGETYYWRIDVNAPAVYQSDVWSFETMAAPTGDPNLYAWWKLDETSRDGENVFDASGNEHYGTVLGTSTLVYDTERDCNVVYFPGNKNLSTEGESYINCGGGGKADYNDPCTWADNLGPMTAMAWFKKEGDFYISYECIVSKTSTWSLSRMHLEDYLKFWTKGLDPEGSHPDLYGTAKTDDGEWHHIAGVYDGAMKYLYIDGKVDASHARTGSMIIHPVHYYANVCIGASPPPYHNWKGWISDVRLFDRALSRLEIAIMGVKDPNKAWWPYPANNAVDVSDSPLTLTWRLGNNVAATGGHRVYLGTDKALVDACDVSVDYLAQDVNYLDVGGLALDMTYYWRVDESNGATTWRGLDWTFDTANYKLFDDFESYNFGANLISGTWEVPAFPGATINLGESIDNEPVNGGEQSMIYEYDNTVSGWNWYSETYRDFGGSPQDWSYATGDVKSLRLYFYGETGNDPDVMYVVLEDSNTNDFMKLYDGDSNDLKAGEWKEWDIALSDFTTVHLGYIKTVYLGFGERGLSGMDPPTPLAGTMYFDDFRVYPPRCVPERLKPDGDVSEDCIVDYEDVDVMMGDWLDNDITVAPSNPGGANLVGWWNFDDLTANDSSGNTHHGTIVTGDPNTSISIVYDAVRDSNVLDVNNIADANNAVVDCGGDANDVGDPCWANLTEQVSVAAWFTLDSIHSGDQYMLTKGNTWQITSRGTSDGIRSYYEQLSPTSLNSTRPVMDGDWHHVAITYDSTAPARKLYIDGREAGSDEPGEPTGTLNVHWDSFVIGGRLNASYIQRGWQGRIDDVRYYDDVLTHAEVVYLMTGSTDPVYFDVYSPANITDAGDPCDSRFVNFKDYDVLADNWLTELLWPSGW